MNNWVILSAVLAIAGAASSATAQNFPSKPVRIVVPYPAGGPIDMTTRPLAQKLTDALGNTVVVDNRGGANGMIGTDNVAKSPPDGYSLVVASGGAFAIGPHVYAKMPFDVFKDFAPVSLFVTLPELLAVHPALPVKSVKDLVALAKQRPNQLNFGSSGTGSTPQLAAEMLKSAAKIQMVHVPYKGMGPATMDLIAGQLQLVFADLPVLMQQVKGGKLRALAVGTLARSPSLQDVPTMSESGYPQVEAYNWYALYAPAATPKPIVARLNAEVIKVMSNPDMKSFNQAQGAEAKGSTPEELAALHKREYDKWASVVKAAGIKPE
ncbi:MAG: tripartite tricarboxylate transporter substrate binding protein [Burkholderiales bacterium]